MDVVTEALNEKFSKKKAVLEANFTADQARLRFRESELQVPAAVPSREDGRHERAHPDRRQHAAALGAVYAGATVGAWYPITPATSLMEAFKEFCEQYRVDPTTKEKKFCIIQAEDELAAAGMVIGACWAGARAFTSTAGPGIRLMQEFIGLAYYTEMPAVFFDVQRTGPSTGMPTRTQQGDLLSIAYASHGDTKHIMHLSERSGGVFLDGVEAFDLAERFQTPVFVVSDLDIGMNDWMCPRFTWDDEFRPDRGKVLGPAELEKIEKFDRYLDLDGDGIAARTLPGQERKGAFFTRGSGHDKYGAYTEESAAYQEVVDRIARKINGIRRVAAGAGVRRSRRARRSGSCRIGGCDAAVREASDA